MGVLLVHVLCLKLQASSLTLDNQFIMPLTQFTRTIDNFIAGVDMQTLCHSKVVCHVVNACDNFRQNTASVFADSFGSESDSCGPR